MILMRSLDQTKSKEWQLRAAIEQALSGNKTGTVVMPDDVIDIDSGESVKVRGHVSLISEGAGNRATRLRFRKWAPIGIEYDPSPSPWQLYGCVIRDVEIRSGANWHDPMIGIRLANCSGFRVSDVKIYLASAGEGSIGIQVAGRESLKFDAPVVHGVETCFHLVWGDNIQVRDIDMAANGKSSNVRRIFKLERIHSLTLDAGTTQTCNQILAYTGEKNAPGQNLTIANLRCEQMIDAGLPGIQVDATRGGSGHTLETLNMYGVRLSQRFVTPLRVANVLHESYGANFLPKLAGPVDSYPVGL